jgi:LacI family transcriptional regulator
MSQSNQSLPAPKLKDVADNAGVSPTTASMVFNGTGRISEETRQRVLESAGRMGYQHRVRERRPTNDGKHVAILILIDREWSFIWHFLTDMIFEIDSRLARMGLKTIMVPISHHDDDETIYQKIIRIGCRSVFSVHVGKERLFQRLEEEGIPVIIIMNNNYQNQFFSICIDDFQGAYDGTRYLIETGHRRIDFVDSIREDLPRLSSDRYFGYRKALEEAGMEFNDSHRISCRTESSEEELEQFFLNSLHSSSPPTALFCLDDEIAFRVWNALKHLGYSIPGDISILAPGDVLDYSKPYIPSLTTMHIDMNYVGRLAVELLNNRIRNSSDTVHTLTVKQQLTKRGSCRGEDAGT